MVSYEHAHVSLGTGTKSTRIIEKDFPSEESIYAGISKLRKKWTLEAQEKVKLIRTQFRRGMI